MDDVNMSSLICEEDITKELEQFNVKIDGEDNAKDVLLKLKNICLIYDFNAEKLVSEWLGFCSKKTWPTNLNTAKIELFENEGFRQEKLKLEQSNEQHHAKEKQKPHIQLDADMLNDYGIMITDEDVQKQKTNQQLDVEQQQNKQTVVTAAAVKTNGNQQNSDVSNDNVKSSSGDTPSIQQQNGHTNGEKEGVVKIDQTITNGNKNNNNNCIIENQLNESVELAGDNQLQNSFGELISVHEWVNLDKTKFNIQPFNHELHLTKPYKTGIIKTHEANDILNESIDDMYQSLMRGRLKTDEIADSSELGESLFIGRVNLDTNNSTDAKNKALLFESPRLYQCKIKLDLSKVSNYSLFPGKIVCFEGELQPETSKLVVDKFFDDELLLPSFNQMPIKFTTTATTTAPSKSSSIYLMTASGPISPSMSDDLSNLEYLLNQVKIFQPHYLILFGPFFDCRNDYLLFNCDGENFFNKIMRMISSSLENIITEAIIVPSTFDLNNYNLFPAPPFEHSFPKINFMPNPSILNLNGIVISLSSVDIFRHIIKEEIKNTDNDLSRICEHLLTQKNLYPLYPPNSEVNLEYSKLDFIKFNVRPHLFIIPSMCKNFIKNVHGSLFLNPEYISKGVFSKIRIDCPSDDNYVGSIEEYTRVEIVKSKSTK